MDKIEKEMLAAGDNQYALRQTEAPKQTLEDIPQYKIKQALTDEQKERLSSQFKQEFEALQTERKELGLEAKWASLDRQYDGELKPNKKLTFNLHCQQSKVKEDAIVRALNEAFLDSDPIVDVSPRPEMQKQDGQEVCDAQAQFIDYEMDENIRPASSFVLINHSAVRKYVGIGKLEWDYKKERRKREEVYDGKFEPVIQNGQPVIDPRSNRPLMENKALKEFEANYPDAKERYASLYNQIASGKRVSIVVEYMDTLANNAKLRYVKLQDFWVANSTKGLSGLKNAHLVVERQTYRWHELEAKEKNEEFENIDQVGTGEDREIKEYSVYEATTYFRMNDGDKEETKIKAWFAETSPKEKQNENVKDYVLLGCILYPYFSFDIDYLPFWVKLNDEGFFGGAKSVIMDLRDSNIAQDAILNLMLDGSYKRNILTPIVREGSEIEQQFIENKWIDGKPISIDQNYDDVNKGIGFVQYPQQNFAELVGISQILKKLDSDVTGVTDLMTGRESQSDPRAPATKTIALLNQSGINIKDYIRTYLPSFNEFVSNILGLYYQMSQEGRKFKVGRHSAQVTGQNPFATISRDSMIARTNVQARAASFAFDKNNEKQENMLALQMILTNPYLMRNPQVVYEATKLALSSQSPLWKNFAQSKLPSPEEFNKQMQEVAFKAIMAVMSQQQQATGIPGGGMTPEQGAGIAEQAQAEVMMPPQEKK